jgi:hypothetical protein
MVACKLMWQNMRAYHTSTNAKLLLLTTQYPFSYKSRTKSFRTFLLLFLCAELVPKMY